MREPSRGEKQMKEKVNRSCLALLVGFMSACVAPQPNPKQVASITLGDPQSTFESFVTAHQGGLLGVEYSCFSLRLRQKHGLSQHAYREFRDQLLEQEPNLTWALYRARVDEIIPLGPARARLLAHVDLPPPLSWFKGEIPIEVELVLEDRYEVLANNRTLAAQGGPPDEFDLVRAGILSLSEDGRSLTAKIPLSGPLEGGDLDTITSIALNSRWLMDSLKLGSVHID